MTRKKLLTLALAGTLGLSALITPGMAVEASPTSVSGYDSLISELKAEENEASSKLTALQADIKDNEAEADELVAEMSQTEEALEGLRTDIEQLNQAIALREEQLNQQARGVQVNGQSENVINFVLNAESLNDVIGRIDVVSTLLSSNKQTIVKQEEDKALVEEKEVETVEKQEEQTKLAGKLETNKALLEEKEAEQESLLAEIASEKAVAESERSALIAQAQAAEARRQQLAAARTVSAQTTTVASNSNTNTNSETSSNSNSNSGSVSTSSASSKSAPASTPAPAPAPAPAANNGSVIGIAHSLSGIRYVYGGGTLSGFDCSGFTSYVFAQAGRSLPRTAAGQYSATSRISRSQAQPGDLVFFRQGGGIDHVGIYLGGGSFIGAQTSTGVAVASVDSGYWANFVVGYGR